MGSVVVGQSIQTPPRLVVNIVVGAMRAGDIDRYRALFGDDGFVKLADDGVNFTSANYNFHQTITPTSLATLSTGALPSAHGVVGQVWWEYILGDKVDLIADKGVKNLDYNIRDAGYSAHKLVAQTLSEALISANPKSQSASVAIDPQSAIMMCGAEGGTPYWIDRLTCEWGSSTAFMKSLPGWVSFYNKSAIMNEIIHEKWISMLPKRFYVNTYSSRLKSKSEDDKYEADILSKGSSREAQLATKYEQISHTPVGNKLILEYAKQVVENMNLGGDEHPDILNIYFDPARNIAQRYGASSVETEDMLHSLDYDLGSFMRFINKRIPAGEVVYVLTSDHGISPTYGDDQEPKGKFNSSQFIVLTDSFLRARYGEEGNWILGYNARNLYLNHELIYQRNLSISEVQNEVASFALQFRGVAHALTASALRNGYFAGGYGAKMQNSFYPRRSGDIILNFMPGWIDDIEGVRADAGSTYNYDTHVPLMILGEGYFIRKTIKRDVKMESVAPTIAHILQIESPIASDGKAIDEIVDILK